MLDRFNDHHILMKFGWWLSSIAAETPVKSQKDRTILYLIIDNNAREVWVHEMGKLRPEDRVRHE